MLITGNRRDRELEKLSLPPAILALTHGDVVHQDLEFRCQKLKYSHEPEDFSPPGIDVYPLWEDDLSVTGFFYNEGGGLVFIRHYFEDHDKYLHIGESVQDLIDYLVREYAEDEQELRSILAAQ